MTDIDDQALAEPAEQQPEATPEVAPAQEQGGEERTYAGKFTTADDLEKGYRELEREFHARNQQQQEPEPEPYNPLDYLTPDQDESVAQRFYAHANQGAAELAEAAQIAVTNVGEHGITRSLANQLWAAYQQADPLGAQEFSWQVREQAFEARLTERFEGYAKPAVDQTNRQMFHYALDLASRERPDLKEESQRQAVADFMEQNQWILNGAWFDNPAELSRRLVYGRDLLFGQQTKGVFAPPAGDQTVDDSAKTKAATTKSRGSSTANDGALNDVEESILRGAKRVR